MSPSRRPSVLLLGDSIRMAYQPYVRQEAAHLTSPVPRKTVRPAANLRANLDRWAVERPASIIHLNAGLHDLRYDPGRDAPVVSMDEYESNVRTILERLRERTGARLIWATTTPVHDFSDKGSRFLGAQVARAIRGG